MGPVGDALFYSVAELRGRGAISSILVGDVRVRDFVGLPGLAPREDASLVRSQSRARAGEEPIAHGSSSRVR